MRIAARFLALVLLFPAGKDGYAQAQPSAVDDGSTELTVSVNKVSVKSGDTLTLFITMKNMHGGTYCHQVIGETGKAELNGYKVEITDSEGNILPLLKQQRPRAWSYWGQCLDHGKTTSEKMELSRLVDMSKLGEYHIRVSHLDKMTKTLVWSNSIVVTIAP